MEGNHKAILHKDYYKVLEVDYDATDEDIRLNYRRLALKWHPDKHKGDDTGTAKFQEINEAYKVLSDPVKRLDYDLSGNYEIEKYTLLCYKGKLYGYLWFDHVRVYENCGRMKRRNMKGKQASKQTAEYLSRFKGMILTCNGLGISHTSIWSEQLIEAAGFEDE